MISFRTKQSWARQEDLWIETFLWPLVVTFVFCGHHKWCEFFIWFKWWRIETTPATHADRSWEKNAFICGSRVMLRSSVGLFLPGYILGVMRLICCTPECKVHTLCFENIGATKDCFASTHCTLNPEPQLPKVGA